MQVSPWFKIVIIAVYIDIDVFISPMLGAVNIYSHPWLCVWVRERDVCRGMNGCFTLIIVSNSYVNPKRISNLRPSTV